MNCICCGPWILTSSRDFRKSVFSWLFPSCAQIKILRAGNWVRAGPPYPIFAVTYWEVMLGSCWDELGHFLEFCWKTCNPSFGGSNFVSIVQNSKGGRADQPWYQILVFKGTVPNKFKSHPKMIPKWSQSHPKVILKWHQNDRKVILKWS